MPSWLILLTFIKFRCLQAWISADRSDFFIFIIRVNNFQSVIMKIIGKRSLFNIPICYWISLNFNLANLAIRYYASLIFKVQILNIVMNGQILCLLSF